jgi:Neuraminidase (sialidase)
MFSDHKKITKEIAETIKTSTGEASLGDTARPIKDIILKYHFDINNLAF